MVEFHQSSRGGRFFDADLPNLIKVINKLGDQLERFNFNMEEITLANITVEGEKIEPFIRKIITEQIHFDNEARGVEKRGD